MTQILYRVDRTDNPARVPCGMLSILHSGNSFAHALQMFHVHDPGFDFWDKPDRTYGIVLSAWNPKTQSFDPIKSKGFDK